MQWPLVFRSTLDKAVRIGEQRAEFWREKFEETKRNDCRDPKTGRFTKCNL